MDPTLFPPIPTCEIPPPILEGAPADASGGGASALPRILRQAEGRGIARRNLRVLVGLFALLGAAEGILLARLPSPRPLVVYAEAPALRLIGPAR